MKIYINDEERSLSEAVSLRLMLEEIGMDDTQGCALALNESVIPKDKWNDTKLKENDKVIIIKATRGG
ncbi:MAG: sulfur carrier protein ThiS [Candidatus Kapabacteria bacterium]|jgi:sulfur carrier protein|nr:sulfur carrier protein ThiS [Candidatus Kapabacteria bacterium]